MSVLTKYKPRLKPETLIGEAVIQEPVLLPHPGALGPVPIRYPFGITDFAYLYSLIEDMDESVATLSDDQTFEGDIIYEGDVIHEGDVTYNNATVHMVGSTDAPLTITTNDAATGTINLILRHSNSNGVGNANNAVGIEFHAETAVESSFRRAATIAAGWWGNNSDTTYEGELVFTVPQNGTDFSGSPGQIKLRPAWLYWPVKPNESTSKAMILLGDAAGSFVGHADGTYIGANAISTGWTGDWMNYEVDGVSVFKVDNDGDVYVRGSLLGAGGSFLALSGGTLTGKTIFNGPSSDLVLSVPRTAAATANRPVVAIGDAPFDGVSSGFFAGNGNGTYLGINADTAFNGNLADFQKAGVSVFKVHATSGTTVQALISNGAVSFGAKLTGSQSAGLAGDLVDWAKGSNTYFLIDNTGETIHTVRDASATGPTAALRLRHTLSSGTAAAPIGVGLQFEAPDDAGTNKVMGTIRSEATAVTAGATVSDLVFLCLNGGSTPEVMRFKANGDLYQSSVKRRLHRGLVIGLMQGFTPSTTGPDTAEVTVPYDPEDGTTSRTYNVRRIELRVAAAGGAPAVTVEKSTASTAFSAATVGTVTLSSGAYEGSVTSSLGTVASGNKLRANVGALGTAAGWTLTVTLEQQ